MWRYSFLAQERVQKALQEAEQSRAVQAVPETSRTALQALSNRVLNRVPYGVRDLAGWALHMVGFLQPRRQGDGRSVVKTR